LRERRAIAWPLLIGAGVPAMGVSGYVIWTASNQPHLTFANILSILVISSLIFTMAGLVYWSN